MNCIQSGKKIVAEKKMLIDLFFFDAEKYNYILQAKLKKKKNDKSTSCRIGVTPNLNGMLVLNLITTQSTADIQNLQEFGPSADLTHSRSWGKGTVGGPMAFLQP